MVSHSVLLVVGGALLTGLIGALVFGSNGTAEERRMREERRLLRALEAQRRIRDAQIMRQGRPRETVEAQPLPQIEQQPTANGAVADEAEAENRAVERQRKRDEHEQAVALKAQRGAEKQERRREEKEHKAALKAERQAEDDARRELEEQRKRDAHAQAAAAKAQRDADARELKLAAKPEPAAPSPPKPKPSERAPVVAEKADKADRPLSELPLYSWAARIDTEDRDAAP